MKHHRTTAIAAVLAAAGLPAAAQTARTIDGSLNNPSDPAMGQAGSLQIRDIGAAGTGLPAMKGGPNARAVSNAIGVQTASGNDAGLSALFWQWGQFIDHDLVLTAGGGAFSPLVVPAGDPVFPAGSVIPFARSAPTYDANAQRQYANQITHFLDGSMVYGSDDLRASVLRSYNGGRMLMGPDNYMPTNAFGLENGNEGHLPDSAMFLAGDVRANEQAGLAAMHTVFAREHNHWADRLADQNPKWDDERIYQTARKIVGAEIQAITYNEWLPAMLGAHGPADYAGYDSSVDPSISLVFSTAAFRFGHTMLNEELHRINEDGSTFDGGNLDLHSHFFNPSVLTADGAMDALLRGMAAQQAEAIDTQVVGAVRNMLFGPPGAGGLDLMALNLLRGRDHGIGTFNEIRASMGLAAIEDWSDLTSDADLAQRLASVYAGPDQLDAWVGFVAEDHLEGAAVGSTLALVLTDQFERLRDGDRFFYLNDPDLAPYLTEIGGVSLGDIIARNTGISGFDGSVFHAVPAPGGVGLLAAAGLLAARRRRA